MTTISLTDVVVVDEAARLTCGSSTPSTAPRPTGADNSSRAPCASWAGAPACAVEKAIPVGGRPGRRERGRRGDPALGRWGVTARSPCLGGDVPFCLVGGRALVEGVGERVTPLPFVARA